MDTGNPQRFSHPGPPGPTASAGHRFGVSAAVSILVLTVLFAAYGVYDRQNVIRRGESAATQIADQTALAAEATIDSSRLLLRAMQVMLTPPVRGGVLDRDALRGLLLDLKANSPYVMDLLIVSADGRITDWTGDGTPPDIRDRAYYTAHATRADSLPYIGPPQLSKVHHGEWFFAVSEGIRDANGALRQVLVVIVDVALMRERVSVRLAIPGSSQALLSQDGTVITRTPDHTRYVGQKVSRAIALESLSAGTPAVVLQSQSQLDQQSRILAFRRVGRYPMVAVGTILTPALLAEWEQRLVLAGVLWLLLSTAIAVVSWRGAAISRLLAERANLDGLTGIPNRRAIMARASDLEQQPGRVGRLSLLMVDVDHFKEINDTYGHLAGDAVLRALSDLLRGEMRVSDLVGRFGGEEFLVLMPDTDDAGALAVAEKLRQRIADAPIEPRRVTVSIGVATNSLHAPSLAETLSRADAALYAAKAAGRNCVRVAAAGTPLAAAEGEDPTAGG